MIHAPLVLLGPSAYANPSLVANLSLPTNPSASASASSMLSPAGSIPLRAPLQLWGPALDAPGAAMPVLDLSQRASPLFALAAQGQLFVTQLVRVAASGVWRGLGASAGAALRHAAAACGR